MDKFQTVLNIFKPQTNLRCGLIALLTAGGENIFSSAAFRCPCNAWNFSYGMVFLMVPALVLLLLGYTLNRKTWKLITGICYRKSKLCRWKTIVGIGMVFSQLTTTAVVAPFTWIAVALLKGDYFQCAMAGVNVTAFKIHLCGGDQQCQEELYKFPCEHSVALPQSAKANVLATLLAESQIMGWLLIASIVVMNLMLTCVARCNSPISYVQLTFWHAYTHQENNLLERYCTEHAKELADRNLKSFFHQTQPKPLVTPSNRDWQKISSLYKFSLKDHFYSSMHQYVDSRQSPDSADMRMASLRSDGPSAVNPAVLAFVDEGDMTL